MVTFSVNAYFASSVSETERNFFARFWSKNSTPSSSLMTSCHFMSAEYTFTPGHLRLALVLNFHTSKSTMNLLAVSSSAKILVYM